MGAFELIRSELRKSMGDKRSKALAALAELEKSAAPQFVAGEVTQEMCQRVAASFYGSDTFANGVEMREALQLWRSELGPTLGLVEIREPTPEECERMENQFTLMTMRLDTSGGRDMFDAVRAIMWPKEGL